MKINLNKEELIKCNHLLDIKESNILAAEIYIDYLNNYSLDIINIKHHSYYKTFKELINNEDLINNEEMLINNNHINDFKELDKNEYLSNEYAKKIHNHYFELKNVKLGNLYYQKYEAFSYDDIKVDPSDYKEITPFGYFNDDFPYLAISEDDQIWMSLIPHEINTMKPLIKLAKGKVLILGLGLGYLAYMANLKDEVQEITIIEQDDQIIEIFKKHLFSELGFKKPLKIIKEDAFTYLNKIKDNEYDSVLCDLWHNVGDGLSMYLKLKAIENNSKAVFGYWIENSIVAMLRRLMLTIFEEQTKYHFKDANYQIEENENDHIINALYQFTKDVEINNFSDLHKLLNDSNLKHIALKLNYK